MNQVKCYKCHTTMEKDSYSRTATCPCCGRTVSYRTKSEKRNYYGGGYSSGYSGGYSSGYSGGGSGGTGCLKVLAIIAAIVILVPLLLLSAIFGDGVWTVVGGILSFLGNALVTVIGFVFKAIGFLVGGLFHLIFG